MKFLGSKTIETDRLVLKAQTMNEQHYLWSVLMLPEGDQVCPRRMMLWRSGPTEIHLMTTPIASSIRFT